MHIICINLHDFQSRECKGRLVGRCIVLFTELNSNSIYLTFLRHPLSYCLTEDYMMTGEEAVEGCKEYIQIMKGMLTKRPRQSSPLDLGGRGGGSHNSGEFEAATSTSASSGGLKDSTQEEEEEEAEEDMANCLILLGQERSQKLMEPIVLKAYECKTCTRCFPSFQALGGHRASHKKSPIGDDEKKKSSVLSQEEEEDQIHSVRTALSLRTPNHRLLLSSSSSYKKKYSKKVHECSICGTEFSSGQALGGHMRRHRTTTSSSHHDHDRFPRVKKSRNNCSFDLNLPAPEDDDDDDDQRNCNSPFAFKKQVIVFSASSLVDCHY